MLTDIQAHKLIRLIQKLNDAYPLSPVQRELKRNDATLDFFRDYTKGELEAFRVKYKPAEIMRHPPDNAADNLDWQIYVFDLMFDDYMRLASPLPPNVPWRITVILRRAKRFDLESQFLAAYLRHFWSARGSATDTKLGQRAIKIGIGIPSVPDSTPLPLPPIDQTTFTASGIAITVVTEPEDR